MKTFRHSGDMGDIIYSLPTVRALGGGDLYLSIGASYTNFRLEQFNFLYPLLMHQPYIHEVFIWYGEPINYDLDAFRFYGTNLQKKNLAEAHLEAFNLDPELANQKWLYAKSKHINDIIINRTERYHGQFNWFNAVMGKPTFIGTKKEHVSFCNRFDHVDFYQVESALDMAEVIQGSGLFIGNQSLAFAISEGLHKLNMLEISDLMPNCNFKREGHNL